MEADKRKTDLRDIAGHVKSDVSVNQRFEIEVFSSIAEELVRQNIVELYGLIYVVTQSYNMITFKMWFISIECTVIQYLDDRVAVRAGNWKINATDHPGESITIKFETKSRYS